MNEFIFHFIRPWWFLALIPLFLVLWRMSKVNKNQKAWTGIIDPALLPHVLVSKEVSKKTWPKYLLGLAGCLSIVSLAGPAWEQLPQPVFRNESALVIAMDLSRSMDAADLKPSRLIKARFKIADLLKERKEGQTALLAFASNAYTVTPLTNDTATITSQLMSLSTDLMPQQGSRADRAMLKASDLLKQAGYLQGDILLITDGINLDRDKKVAEQLKSSGYRLSILGVGTKDGAPIPDSRGGFFADAAGNIVLPSLDKRALRKLARAGGGSYQTYKENGQDVKRIVTQLDADSLDKKTSETDLKTDQWLEEGPWILLLIIPFAALAFRKGYLIVFLFVGVGLTTGPEASAADFTTEDLWLRADQKAQKLFEAGNSEAAAEVFEDKQWKGSAQYKAGDYDAALESWQNDDRPSALYNKGNALAKLGKLEEAQESYKKLLEAQPDHEDAKHNLEQVEEAIKKQKEQQKQDQEKGEDQDKNESNKEEQDKDQEKQEGDQEQKSEEGEENEEQDGQPEDSENQEDSQEKNQQQSPSDKEESEEQDKERQSDKNDKSDDADNAEEDEKEAKASQQETVEEEVADEEQEGKHQGERAEPLDEEEKQAIESALRSIPDDPGGLLRRKFKYQYQRQAREADSEEQQW